MKKILLICMFLIIPNCVFASSTILLKIDNKYYDNLLDAINAASSSDTITLLTNITLEETININKTININLNGNTISSKEKVFLVEGGSLYLSGSGIVKEIEPNYGAIIIKGSNNPNDINYSTLKIDSGITLEGWSGIFVPSNEGVSYGVLVNTEASIISKEDKDGITGAGIYINGNIKNNKHSPIININGKSIINSSGTGIYQAGYAITTINNAKIEGKESAISIKSGVLNIKDGTYISKGEDKTPTTSNNNGINPSGATIQIESNDNYKGDIIIKLEGGNFTSKNSHVIYEYHTPNTITKVNEINITKGTYQSNKSIFLLSNSLKNQNQPSITGGAFSKDIEEYLDNDYHVTKIDNMYQVIKATMKEEILKKEQNNSIKKTIIYIIFFILLSLIIFLNKTKILKLIKFSKHN